MNKRIKWTYEKVKEIAESEGYILRSTEYINTSTKLKMICPNGHECEISWSNFYSNNRRCRKCGIKKSAEKQKLTIEHVRKEFEKKGCILLEKEYINAHTPMNYICNNGHEHKITWSNFNSGQGCSKCRNERLREERQYSQEFVFNTIKSFGYEIISKEYIKLIYFRFYY